MSPMSCPTGPNEAARPEAIPLSVAAPQSIDRPFTKSVAILEAKPDAMPAASPATETQGIAVPPDFYCQFDGRVWERVWPRSVDLSGRRKRHWRPIIPITKITVQTTGTTLV